MSTPCKFDSTNISISMDVLPAVNVQPSTLVVAVGGEDYVQLRIPSLTELDEDVPVATVRTLHGMRAGVNVSIASSANGESLVVGGSTSELVWTSWTLNFSLPIDMLGVETQLTLAHHAPSSGVDTSDIAVDNIIVHHGSCGTSMACVCVSALYSSISIVHNC